MVPAGVTVRDRVQWVAWARRQLPHRARSRDALERSRSALALAQVVLEGRSRIAGGADPQPDEAEIRARFRTLIAGGALPRVKPSRVWAGPCRDAHPCAACGGGIATGSTEIEVQTVADVVLYLHQRCFDLWLATPASDGDPS